jgi:hypothetical protein
MVAKNPLFMFHRVAQSPQSLDINRINRNLGQKAVSREQPAAGINQFWAEDTLLPSIFILYKCISP